jgi:hypothetical protein
VTVRGKLVHFYTMTMKFTSRCDLWTNENGAQCQPDKRHIQSVKNITDQT